MKKALLGISILAAIASTNILAADTVTDEASLNNAISKANVDSSINKIVFARNARISLSSPIIYTGRQNLTLQGNGATLDGAKAGSFVLDSKLLAYTKDATLVFKTTGDISINELSVVNSATRGIVVKIPDTAQGNDIKVTLQKVHISGSALYGLHIDDNADEFDDGNSGSAIGIELYIADSSIIRNGIGAIDFDGIRVDEREQGGIAAVIINTHIDNNGGDGLELDEAGDGHVTATLKQVTFNDNGFYNKEDLDDGFDIDERGAGDIEVFMFNVQVHRNQDEGLDFDEADAGSVKVKLHSLVVTKTTDEGIKLDEDGVGDINAQFFDVLVSEGGNDGIQMTEQEAGRIDAELKKVSAINNKNYGVIIEQWHVKGEDSSLEKAGTLKIKELTLSGNGNGDKLELNNIDVE